MDYVHLHATSRTTVYAETSTTHKHTLRSPYDDNPLFSEKAGDSLSIDPHTSSSLRWCFFSIMYSHPRTLLHADVTYYSQGPKNQDYLYSFLFFSSFHQTFAPSCLVSCLFHWGES